MLKILQFLVDFFVGKINALNTFFKTRIISEDIVDISQKNKILVKRTLRNEIHES